MTLPFRCEDCGSKITLTPDEMLAIYDARIALCQACIDSIEEDARAYAEMGVQCGTWDRLAPTTPGKAV